MGENKAFIEIDGIPIIQRICNLFRTLFSEIIIVTNEPELFLDFEARIYDDIIRGRGVLGGLYTGIFYASFPYAFCVACDMPFLKAEVIRYLMRQTQHFDVIVPKTKDGLEPLHAIYSKNCLGPIKRIMDQGKRKVLDFYPMVSVRTIESKEFHFLDPAMESFMNVNTPEELMSARKSKHLCRQ
jgi:molybdopterin-guanine dinucleotide biosynthesis protein A